LRPSASYVSLNLSQLQDMPFRPCFLLACIRGIVGPLLPWTDTPGRWKPQEINGKGEHSFWMEKGGKFDSYTPDAEDYNDKPVRLFEGAHEGTDRFKPTPRPGSDETGRPWVTEPWECTLYVNLDGKPGGRKETITLKVHPEWAPEAANRFQDLVATNSLDETRFYRVIKNYIAQFGIPAKPETAQHWEAKPLPEDDGSEENENRRGTVAFAQAGPGTRTTQMYFNMKDNEVLDRMNFIPFAEVLGDGMKVIDRVQDKYAEQPDMNEVMRHGNSYLQTNFPDLSYIERCEYSFPEAQESSRRNLKMRSRSEEV